MDRYETLVINDETEHSRDYRRYPYGGYKGESNSTTLYPHDPIDERRPPKERVRTCFSHATP